MSVTPRHRFKLAALLPLIVTSAWSQTPPTITPTVTVTMGDVGGKRFGKAPDPRHIRQYYVAAEPVQWDYAPEGKDPVCGKALPPPVQDHQPVGKLRYIQYTDATFAAKALPTPRLGILGPVLRGVVGETLLVTFLNRTSQPLSMHPHGVSYDKDSEGAHYLPKPGLGAAVAPGAKFTYVWQLDSSSGPLPNEPSSKAWLYHSHVTGDSEANQGLIGFIVVTDPKRARSDGTPADVDREMAALFMIFDESGLDAEAHEAAEYIATPGASAGVKSWTEMQQMLEAGGRHAVNGLVFGNLTGLEMNQGERVRWYLFGLGSEDDFHTAHWHGERVITASRRTDVVELLPATMTVADMQATNPGSWLFHCHVAEHMTEGMFTQYVIHPKTGRASGTAFFGVSPTGQSMQLTRVEITGAGELQLAGTVTVFDAFTVFNQTIHLELGGKTLTFQPDRSGFASTDEDCTLRIRNTNRYGIVHGGLLEFEIILKGPALQSRITKLKPGRALPVKLQLGAAGHATSAVISKTR